MENLRNLESKLINLKKYKYELHTKLYNNGKEIEKILDEIRKAKNTLKREELNNLECVKTLRSDVLLDDSEVNCILDGIDTSDYTDYGKPRIMDLDGVSFRIFRMKRIFPSFKLVELKKTLTEDRIPPIHYYKYTYFDEVSGCTITK